MLGERDPARRKVSNELAPQLADGGAAAVQSRQVDRGSAPVGDEHVA
jgi:hypothetical protein